MRCMPMRSRPMRCTPMRYTPMRRTSIRCTPIIQIFRITIYVRSTPHANSPSPKFALEFAPPIHSAWLGSRLGVSISIFQAGLLERLLHRQLALDAQRIYPGASQTKGLADCHCAAKSSRYQPIGDFYNMELFDAV